MLTERISMLDNSHEDMRTMGWVSYLSRWIEVSDLVSDPRSRTRSQAYTAAVNNSSSHAHARTHLTQPACPATHPVAALQDH